MTWSQEYNPLRHATASTVVAALPVAALLGGIALGRMRIHQAALLGLTVALAVAVGVYGMPPRLAAAATAYGAAYGLFPIGWIILNLMFLYQLTVEKGHFAILRGSLATLAPDPRVQVILIAFSLGAFFEGAAGFGTPVAVTAAILIQLGFRPLLASGLSLIANTAPVAFGGLGSPIIALSKVTGISELTLSAMIGRQLPFFSLIIPFWVVGALAGFRGMWEVWPAALTAGLAFAIPQYLVANFHGPWLVDIISAMCSLLAVAVLLRYWRPQGQWKMAAADQIAVPASASSERYSGRQIFQAWLPWLLLTACLFVWGLPDVKAWLNGWTPKDWPVPGLHGAVLRGPPIAPPSGAGVAESGEPARFVRNWLSATGSGILFSALLAGGVMGLRPGRMLRLYGETLVKVRFSLLTIAAMLALGYVTRFSGTDATLGLALAKTGRLYPFFGTLLGWLGVALTGSDTASNVLFGSLQKITAGQLGISPTLMAAANSSGGVMGKMVDAQSIVVASTATQSYGEEGRILRFVLLHSLILAALMGLLVFLQAYVWPFTEMVPR